MVWESLLNETNKSRNKNQSDRTVLCVGSAKSGKQTLLARYCSENGRAGHAQTEVLRYDYMSAVDPNDEGEEVELANNVNVWSVDEDSAKYVIQTNILTPSSSTDALLVLICIDITRGAESVADLKKWLAFADRCRSRWLAGLKSETGTSAMDGGCPVVVAACKADLLSSSKDINSLKEATMLQGKFRAACLAAGASLVYTAAQTGSNCDKLHRLILHQLAPESFALEQVMDTSRSTLVVPHGEDSIDMVEAETDVKADLPAIRAELMGFTAFELEAVAEVDGESTKPAENTDLSKGKAGAEQEGKEGKALQDEQEWLQGLHTFISTAVSEGGSSTSALSGATTNAGASDVTDSDRSDAPAPAPERVTRSRLKVSKEGKDAGGATDFFKNLLGGKK